MSQTEIIYYRQEADADAQVLVWLDGLTGKVRNKSLSYVGRLRDFGNNLRRPTGDILQSPIWDLRPTWQGIHYRILYAFAGEKKAILLHGCIKVHRIKERDIAIALEKFKKYMANQELHTYIEE